jgi:hypothetical protein
VPVTRGKILATLWGMFNTNSTAYLTKDSVKDAIYAYGGKTSAIDGLWKQLSPDKKSVINAGDFATNPYLNAAIISNLDSIREAVEDTRRAAGPSGKSGTMLDFFAGGGSGSVLDLFV